MEIITTIDAAVGTIKNAMDIVTVLRDARSKQPHELATAFDAIFKAQQLVMETKQIALSLTDENLKLKKAMSDMESFEAEKQHYHLQAVGPGAFAYLKENESQVVKPVPWFCQACFDNRKKSVLQLAQRDFGHDTYKCHQCGATIMVPNDIERTIATAPIRHRMEW